MLYTLDFTFIASRNAANFTDIFMSNFSNMFKSTDDIIKE